MKTGNWIQREIYYLNKLWHMPINMNFNVVRRCFSEKRLNFPYQCQSWILLGHEHKASRNQWMYANLMAVHLQFYRSSMLFKSFQKKAYFFDFFKLGVVLKAFNYFFKSKDIIERNFFQDTHSSFHDTKLQVRRAVKGSPWVALGAFLTEIIAGFFKPNIEAPSNVLAAHL